MKNQAEAELIKTLNGQLKELPALAKTMVQQYQLSAIVLSALCGVLFVAALVGTVWLSVWCYKKSKTDYGDYWIGIIVSSSIGGIASIGMFLALCENLIHACAPIASIISSIFSN